MSFDEQQSNRLRAGIADIDTQLTRLRDQPTNADFSKAMDTLSTSWKGLVASMALAEEPERRACPFCSRKIMLLATRCVHCWRKSAAHER